MIRVLLPDARRWPHIEVPLAKRLGQANRSRLRANTWLAQTFGLADPQHWPAAALTRMIDRPETDSQSAAWLRADPAWIKADINGGKLLGVGETLPMTPEDVQAFLPTLMPLFGDAGMPIDAPNPHRWYLRLTNGTPLPPFSGPIDALGDDAFSHMDFEGTHRRWKTLMSEAQILLHQHPRNEVRLAQGLAPINSLWFWGQGELPPKRPIQVGRVFTRDAILAGLARHQGVSAIELTDVPDVLQDDDVLDLRGVPVDRVQSNLNVLTSTRHVQCLFEDFDALEIAGPQRYRIWRKPLQPGDSRE